MNITSNHTCKHRVCCFKVGVLEIDTSDAHQDLWLVLQVLATSAGVVLNTVLAWAIRKTRQMQRSAFMLLSMFSFVNNIVFAVAGLVNFALVISGQVSDCHVYVANKFLVKVTQNMFINYLLAMSYCRYIYAKYTKSASNKITKKRVQRACAVLLVAAILNSSPTILTRIFWQVQLQVEAEATFALTLLVLSVAIVCTYYTAVSAMKQHESSQIRNYSSLGKKKMIKVAISTAAILVTLQVPFATYAIFEVVWVHTGSHTRKLWEKHFILLGQLLYQLNPLASGVLVLYNNRELTRCLLHVCEQAKPKFLAQRTTSGSRKSRNFDQEKPMWKDIIPEQRREPRQQSIPQISASEYHSAR